MAQIHKELRKKEPTSLHTDLTKYIKSTTGHDADVETVKLTMLLAPIYRTSEENERRREREAEIKERAEQARLDGIAAKRQAIEDRKAAEKADRARKLREKLAALEADDDAPAPRRAAAKAAPVKAAKAPTKKAAAKVVPIKRAKPVVEEPTEDRGGLRETEAEGDGDDGWGDTEPY
jgi:hypothetical protein